MLESCRLLPPQLPALMENRGWGKRRHLILNNSEGFVFCFWASHRSGLQKAIYFPNEITLACVLVWVQCSAVVCHLTSIFRLSPTLPPTAYETTGKLQQWLLQGKHNRQKSRPRSWTYNQALNQIFPSWRLTRHISCAGIFLPLGDTRSYPRPSHHPGLKPVLCLQLSCY